MDTVLFEKKNQIGLITLNAPKKLNSLDTEMIIAMTENLKAWEEDPAICAVIMKTSSERAFCAGGDVKSLYFYIKEDKEKACEFFKHEYHLDHYIHQFKKPIVCLTEGVTMGGGIGIMNGCSHRIVCETNLMAMPEITIGLFPDVGASHFLNTTPDNIGLFLGLTGAKFNGADALYLKMAEAFINKKYYADIEKDVLSTSWSENNKENYNIVHRLIDKYKGKSEVIEGLLEKRIEQIKKLIDFSDFEELDNHWNFYHGDDEWITSAIDNYKKGSPTSKAVIFEQLQSSKGLSLEEVFKRELHMAFTFTHDHDFKEGVRALLVDKDNNPKWQKMPENIENYFLN